MAQNSKGGSSGGRSGKPIRSKSANPKSGKSKAGAGGSKGKYTSKSSKSGSDKRRTTGAGGSTKGAAWGKKSSTTSGKPSAKRSGKPSGASGAKSGGKTTSSSREQAPRGGSGTKKHYTATTRDVEKQRRENHQRRRDLAGAAVNLPNWVIEGLERVTRADRVAPALEALGAASEALADGRYQAAVKHGERAKALAPNDPTIRETIGIAAYRIGDWSKALAELRAYRRIAGESTHLPIEMDVLRALERDQDVEKAWAELQKRGGHGLVMNEGIVVYSSYLIDRDRAKEAWAIANPGRTVSEPNEAHLRLYFVAARAAAALGDRDTAKQLSDTIVLSDPGFPGWEQLEAEIAAIPETR